MAIWDSSTWIAPPLLEGFNSQWTYGYGVACSTYNSNLVLVYNRNDTMRLAIINHESLAVTYYDPPDTVQISYTPDLYVAGSKIYLISNGLFVFDIIHNNWTQVVSGLFLQKVHLFFETYI